MFPMKYLARKAFWYFPNATDAIEVIMGIYLTWILQECKRNQA